MGTSPTCPHSPCATIPYGTGTWPYEGHCAPGPGQKDPMCRHPRQCASLGRTHRGRSHSAGRGSAPSPFAVPGVAVLITSDGVTPPPSPPGALPISQPHLAPSTPHWDMRSLYPQAGAQHPLWGHHLHPPCIPSHQTQGMAAADGKPLHSSITSPTPSGTDGDAMGPQHPSPR